MKKRAIESRVEQVYQIRPEHLNGAGRLFGGRLMEWIDEVAGLVGIRHSQCNVITASVDNLKFIRGVFQNDLVVLVGTLTWVGSTSMEVRVDTYVEKLNGTRYPVNRAYLTLVAVDETGKPTSITSTPIRSSARAICSFSFTLRLACNACSPSRRVVSKIMTCWLIVISLMLFLAWQRA